MSDDSFDRVFLTLIVVIAIVAGFVLGLMSEL